MKQYILLTDNHFQLLAIMGALVANHFSFNYQHSSTSLIVDVNEHLHDDGGYEDFTNICSVFHVKFGPFNVA